VPRAKIGCIVKRYVLLIRTPWDRVSALLGKQKGHLPFAKPFLRIRFGQCGEPYGEGYVVLFIRGHVASQRAEG
jgi:hypothetical protein